MGYYLLTMYKFRIESEIQHLFPSITKALDAAGIAYFIKNEQLEYVHANDNFLSLVACENINKLTDFDLFISDIAHEQRRIEENVLTTQMSASSESVVITKNKLEKLFQITRSFYKEGDSNYIIAIVKDITEQKQQEQFQAYKQILTGDEVYEKVINRFSSYIFNNTDEDKILNGVGKLCIDILNLEDISIFIYNSKAKQLEERVYVGKDNILKYEAHNPLILEEGQGIVGAAAESLQAVLVNNVSEDQRYIAGAFQGKSELAVPIIYKKQLLGVIDTEHSDRNFYNNKHLKLLEGIATLLAIKLHELDNYKLLKINNAQLNAFVRDSPVAMAILDRNLNYIACSKSWIEGSQFDSSNIIGLNHYDLYPNLPVRWRKKFEAALKGKTQYIRREYYQITEEIGSWFNADISPWKTEEGKVGGIIIHTETIDELIRQENQINSTAEELQEARKLGKLFTWEFDPNTGQFEWSAGKKTKNIHANSLTEVGTLFEAVDSEYQADFNKKLNEAIQNKSNFQFIHPIRLDNQKYWVNTRGKVKVEEGIIVKIFGTSQDITERIEKEEALQNKNLELEKINSELDQFVYKTAHDLRAPLTNLIGLISVMRNETNPDLLKTYFDLQEKSVEKMDAFIHKITNFTKNSRLPVQADPIDFNKLVDEVFNEYLYYDKSEIIQKTVSINLDVEVHSDIERLKSILSNLVSNAIKFADINKDNPSLNLKIQSTYSDFIIKIEDNGIGIADKCKSRVFDMFYRGHKSSEGAGLGLYIVKETVNKLNGKISLNSKELEGTELSIILPNLNPKLLSK